MSLDLLLATAIELTTETPSNDAHGGGSRRLATISRCLVGPGLSVGITLGALTVVLRLWNAEWRVPFGYNGDGVATGMYARDLLRGPNYLYDPYLGWPDSQHLADIPQGADNFHIGALWLIGRFTDNFGAILNTYFVLTFALVALAAYYALRLLRLSLATSVFGATAFALLPYHFARGESHLFLSAYFMIPFAMVVLLWQLTPEQCLFSKTPTPDGPGWRRALPVATCLLLGMTGAYYAGFFVLLLIPSCLLFALLERSWRIVLSGAACVAITLASILANLAPTFLYWSQNGVNHAFDRTVGETEIYGLKIAQLFLPIPGHRLGVLARLSERSLAVPLTSESGQQLGAIAASGVIVLLGFGIVRIARRRTASSLGGSLFARMSTVAMLALLLAAMGGFSTLLALAGFNSIRVYSRISVVLGFLGIVVVAIGVDQVRRRIALARQPLLLLALPAVLLLVAVFDQTSSGAPDYKPPRAEFLSDQTFVRAAEQALPPGAAVFQLPILAFPEAPTPGRMRDYDPLRGVLHSKQLKFSYGAVKGRDDWQLRLQGLPTPVLIRVIRSIGYQALWVDRFGYTDSGRRLERGLAQYLGPPIVSSRNGRFELFSLAESPAVARLGQLPREVAHSPFAHSTSGFGPIQQSGDDAVYVALAPTATFGFVNVSRVKRRAVADFRVASASHDGGHLAMKLLGVESTLKLSSEEQDCRLQFDALPGQATLELQFDGPAADVPPIPGLASIAAAPYFRLIDVQVYDAKPETHSEQGTKITCR